jgi:hypothetical protein
MANFLNELRKGNFYNLVRLRNLIRNLDQGEIDEIGFEKDLA